MYNKLSADVTMRISVFIGAQDSDDSGQVVGYLELLAHHDLAAQVKPDQMKNCLTKINADGVQFYGKPPEDSHTQAAC
jgi:hypothetical protein